MPEPDKPFWPSAPPRLTEDQLVEFTGDFVADRLFTSRHLPSYDQGGAAFSAEFGSVWPIWALLLETHGVPPDTYTAAIGIFFSYMCDANTFTKEGRPLFMACPRALHREDWLIVHEAIRQARDRAQETPNEPH